VPYRLAFSTYSLVFAGFEFAFSTLSEQLAVSIELTAILPPY